MQFSCIVQAGMGAFGAVVNGGAALRGGISGARAAWRSSFVQDTAIPFARGYSRNAAARPGVFNIFTGLDDGLREVLAEGARLEDAARAHIRANLGERIIPETQFRRGAALRGFDVVSFSGTGRNAKLFINEVKNVTGRVSGSKFTVFGLGWGGRGVFDDAIDQARKAIVRADVDQSTRAALLRQLRDRTATIRLIGNSAKGTLFSPNVIERLRHSTAFDSVTGFNL